MKNSLTIRTRLIFTLAFLGLLIMSIGVMGIYGMKIGNTALEDVYSNQLASSIAISNSKNSLSRARFTLDRAIFHPDHPDVAKTLDRAAGFIAESDKFWQIYLALPRDSTEDALAKDLDAKRKTYIESGLQQLSKAITNKDVEQTDALAMKGLQTLFGHFNTASDKLDDYQMTGAKENFDQSNSSYHLLMKLAIGGIIIGAVLIVISSISLLRAILNPLNYALNLFEKMAAGDLSNRVEVHSGDEMGKLLTGLSNMQTQLVSTVRDVREGSDSIATASSEIAAGNMDLSRRTEQQAASLEETASSLEELTSTVKQNSDNARQANQLAGSASDIAVKGGEIVTRVIDTMSSISASSDKIADIIGVIDGIAFQTNILALNAAVEAARAGEQGRGFAVVATEVRNLAHRSASAAKDIKQLIDDSVEKVGSGSALVNEAGETMHEIVASVRRVTDIISEISSAGREQEVGIEQINTAVAEMDTVTQQNAALVEQAAAASQAMQEQSVKLAEIVSVFKVDDVARAKSAPQRTPAAAAKPARPALKLAATNTAARKAPANSSKEWEEF